MPLPCGAILSLRLVIGHGSGSFGHVYGRRYGTRAGVQTPEQWYGFAATADAAARLNRIVIGALLEEQVPAWSIQPGVALRCVDGRVEQGPEDTVRLALARGLIPVVFGDVALDSVRGGTIASTEEIFASLAHRLHPQRLILAGEVDGIFTADPLLDPEAQRIPTITPALLEEIAGGLGGSHGVDVTGGMRAKVEESLAMVRTNPGSGDRYLQWLAARVAWRCARRSARRHPDPQRSAGVGRSAERECSRGLQVRCIEYRHGVHLAPCMLDGV